MDLLEVDKQIQKNLIVSVLAISIILIIVGIGFLAVKLATGYYLLLVGAILLVILMAFVLSGDEVSIKWLGLNIVNKRFDWIKALSEGKLEKSIEKDKDIISSKMKETIEQAIKSDEKRDGKNG